MTFLRNVILPFCPSMIFSENRCPLCANAALRVRIMLPWRPLFRRQRVRTVPVFRRRIFLERADPRLVEVIQLLQRVRLVGLAAALDRRERLLPVAAAVG